ncbi:MAG: arginase family protein [Bryobacteraceae bacterium]|nr:arginase family protein [Bryobacteraceae bacterium]MDW8380095.1 arginase family protein [Bryobacterales bacterium]
MYSILEVPYHMGLEDVAVGKGPTALLRAGVDQLLAEKSMPPQVTHIRPRDLRNQGLELVIDINRMLRYAVKDAVEQESVPVALAGNCNAALGVLAGLDTTQLGIVWFDKHADFHTPETSLNGSIEGMALAIAAGHCHQQLAERIGFGPPISDHNIVLAGVREMERGERERIETSWVSVHAWDSLALLPVALEQLKARVEAVYLHVDTDVLDVVPEVARWVGLVRETLPLAAVSVTNYNPDLDPEGDRALAIAEVIRRLAPGRVL